MSEQHGNAGQGSRIMAFKRELIVLGCALGMFFMAWLWMKNAASISSLGLPVVIVLVVAFKFLVNRVDKKRAGFKCEWCESKEDLRVWDYTLESKVNQVIQQLKEGRAKVVFDLTSETCNIVLNEGKFHV